MGYVPPLPPPLPNWRDDFIATSVYKKRFAIIPTKCSDGNKVWLKPYYSKYDVWSTSHSHIGLDVEGEYNHTDFIERITEAEYIVRRLTEGI